MFLPLSDRVPSGTTGTRSLDVGRGTNDDFSVVNVVVIGWSCGGRCFGTRGVHSEIDEVVCDVEPRGTRMADLVKVFLTLREGTGVDHFAFCEENELIEERGNVRARLMDSEDDGAIKVPCQGDKTLNHIIRIIRIQSRSLH